MAAHNDYYFVGESIDDEGIFFEVFDICEKKARKMAKKELETVYGGGHLDIFLSETDDFVCSVEV